MVLDLNDGISRYTPRGPERSVGPFFKFGLEALDEECLDIPNAMYSL